LSISAQRCFAPSVIHHFCAEEATLRKLRSAPKIPSDPSRRGRRNEPASEARDGCDRKIGGGVAGEFDDRLIVRQLAQVAVQQQGLLVGIAKQGELPARHAQEVAEGLQTAVVANRRLVAGGIGRASLAGRID
jgi:hypothetical protein